MQVHLYTMSWNEADMVPFFLRHYDSWVDRFVVFDDGSTDGTVDCLRAHPRVEVRRFQRTVPTSFVESQCQLHNRVWKESHRKADWVVITALDEHLHIPGQAMRDYLERCHAQQITVVPALGYQMLSEAFPDPDEHLCESRTWGAPCVTMNKLSVFNPNAIEETNFDLGRHAAAPTGRLRLPERDELLLLHYKYLGFQRTYERHQAQKMGLGVTDLAKGHAHRYSWTIGRFREDWEQYARRAVDISRCDLEPWQSHSPPRWWRPAPSGVDALPAAAQRSSSESRYQWLRPWQLLRGALAHLNSKDERTTTRH